MTMLVENLPVLPVVIPLLASVIAVMMPTPMLAWVVSMLATGSAVLAAVLNWGRVSDGSIVIYALGGWEPPWGIAFVLDPASGFTAGVVTVLSFAATLYARGLFEKEISTASLPRVYGAWLLTIGGLLGLVMTGDAFNLFVFLEISSLAAVTLVAMGAEKDRRALTAAFNYLVIGAIGATFYVIGVGFVYAITGTLNMADLAARLPGLAGNTALLAGFGFMVIGMMVKAAVFPLHIWLPAAYAYAPSAVSVMLAAVATKAALYVMLRIIFTVFAGLPVLTDMVLQSVILPLALMAMFSGTILAIYEQDLKKMLAQSSIAQIGYIVFGFGLASPAGIAAGFIHIANHAMMKAGLFMAVGAMALSLGRRARLATIVGLGRVMPLTASGFVICSLSLLGLPLTAGFISKLWLVRAVLETPSFYLPGWLLIGLVLLSSALALVYVWKVIEVLYAHPTAETPAKRPENPVIWIPLWLVALANIYFGIQAEAIIDSAMLATTTLFGQR